MITVNIITISSSGIVIASTRLAPFGIVSICFTFRATNPTVMFFLQSGGPLTNVYVPDISDHPHILSWSLVMSLFITIADFPCNLVVLLQVIRVAETEQVVRASFISTRYPRERGRRERKDAAPSFTYIQRESSIQHLVSSALYFPSKPSLTQAFSRSFGQPVSRAGGRCLQTPSCSTYFCGRIPQRVFIPLSCSPCRCLLTSCVPPLFVLASFGGEEPSLSQPFRCYPLAVIRCGHCPPVAV